MAAAAAAAAILPPPLSSKSLANKTTTTNTIRNPISNLTLFSPTLLRSSTSTTTTTRLLLLNHRSCSRHHHYHHRVLVCLPSSSSSVPKSSTSLSSRLYVSGLSFRTTEEGLRNAFQDFGQLVEVNLVMDRIANRPRGFAFLRYATVEESQKAIEGMHGKFLDGRVIFVEVAKPRSELQQSSKQTPRRYLGKHFDLLCIKC